MSGVTVSLQIQFRGIPEAIDADDPVEAAIALVKSILKEEFYTNKDGYDIVLEKVGTQDIVVSFTGY